MPGRLYLLAVVPPVLAALALVASYGSLPDPMPTHWGFTGEPDAWAPKSMGTLLVNILLGPLICVLAMAGAGAFLQMHSGSLFEPGGSKTPADARRTWHELRVMQPLLGWYCVMLSTSLTLLMLGLNAPWLRSIAGLLDALGMLGILAATIWLLVVGGRKSDAIAKKYPYSDGRRRRWLFFVEIPGSDRVMVDTGSGTNFTFNVATRGGRIGAVVLSLIMLAAAVMLLSMAVAALF